MINHQRSVIWTLTAVITCTVSFFLLDGPIARLVYQNHTALTDSIFRPVTKLGESQGYLVAGALLYLLYRTRRPWMANAWLFLFSSVAVSGLASDLLKIILGRARPKLLLNDGIYGFDFFHLEHAWTSFPSGHATTALSAAVSLSLLYPRFRPLFLAAGFLIALSRIMLSQHYLSDVIAGGFWERQRFIYFTDLISNQYCMDRLPPHSNRFWPWLLLGFMIILSFFAGLGSGPLFDVDEGAFSEATREMLAGHNYLTTFLNGAPRFDKPILIYWLQLLSVMTLGISEIAFRLPSALAAAIWAVATFLFVRKERDNDREALLAAVLMTLSLQVTIIAKAAIADGVLNCSLAVTMFAIYRFYRTEKYSAILLAFASIGVGILDKGPIALIIPFVVSLLFFLLEQKFRLWLRAVLNPVAWLIMLLIVLPWYTLEYLDQGMAFIQGFFFKHNVDRFSSSLEGHSGALFYYIPVVLGGIMPSTGLLFTVLFNLRKLLSDPLNRFCVIWFAFVFVFFSLSGTKLPHYMIYGYTPLFLLMARSFTSSKWPALLAIWPALLLLGFAALPFAGTQLLQRAPSLFIKAQLTATLSLMHEQHFSALMAAAAVAIILIQAISAIRPMYRFILSGTLLLMAVNFSVMPIVASVMQEPVRESALLAKREGYKIVMWKVYYPSFLVYSQSLVEKRVPEAGDIVLTTVDHLDKLGNPRLLYRKNGIVLARVPN